MKKFVLIGHVDTGKSTVAGHLLYKSNYLSEHEMNKIRVKAKADKMERWVWARVLDIYEEEMERGKTHEFTQIDFTYNNNDYQLIDTPGHQAFIRSMIGGIYSGVKIGVVLVSMKENEFNASFTTGMLKEHLILSKVVGIRHLIILANKMDIINWDETKFNNYINQVTNFLKSINWAKKCIHIIPISGYNGIGLTDNKDMPEWFNDKCLIEKLEDIKLKKGFVEPDLRSAKKFYVDLKILNVNGVITPGFECIMHHNGEETQVVIEKIKNKQFGKNGDKIKCLFSTSNSSSTKIDVIRNVIFRKDEYTIGFGNVLFKP